MGLRYIKTSGQWCLSIKPTTYGIWFNVNLPISFSSNRYSLYASSDTRDIVTMCFIRGTNNSIVEICMMNSRFHWSEQPEVTTSVDVRSMVMVIGK